MKPIPKRDGNVPVLTDIIRGTPFSVNRDELVAELQTALAARAFSLTDEILRASFAEMEATLFERISTRLRQELPEIIDATLREHIDTMDD
jgi:hypothetical protein